MSMNHAKTQDQPKLPRSFMSMYYFHKATNFLVGKIYYSFRTPKIEVEREQALSNLEAFVREVENCRRRDITLFEEFHNTIKEAIHTIKTGEDSSQALQELQEQVKEIIYPNTDTKQKEQNPQEPLPLEKALPLEEALLVGERYVPLKDLEDVRRIDLWRAALSYDLKGIVPKDNEDFKEFVYRGNTTLYLHAQLQNLERIPTIKANELSFDINDLLLSPRLDSKVKGKVTAQDLHEACERIPYFMDLRWVAAYVKEELSFPALGLTFTLPQYNGFAFVEMLTDYKDRERYIEVLAHELTHVGTVYLDHKKDFLETKAYAVGKGSLMGEYVVAGNRTENFLISTLRSFLEAYLPIGIPERMWKQIPKIREAINIWQKNKVFSAVREKFTQEVGELGDYFAGRLNAQEMEEMFYTNNVPARIAMKDNFKWKVMKANYRRLAEELTQ